MVEGGLIGKAKLGKGGILVNVFQLRFEERQLTRNDAKLKRFSKDLSKAGSKHRIEKIKKDMDGVNKAAKLCADNSYKLVMHDLIILGTLIAEIKQVINYNKELSKTNKENKGLLNYNKQLEGTFKTLSTDFQKLQRQLFALEKEANDKTAIAMETQWRGKFNIAVLNFFAMRGETNDIRKDITEIIDKGDFVEKAYQDFKNKKLTKEEWSKMVKMEMRLVKLSRDCAEKMIDLFLRDNYILHTVLVTLELGEKIDQKFAEEHEIPLVMSSVDKETKERIRNGIGGPNGQVVNERKALNQLNARLAA